MVVIRSIAQTDDTAAITISITQSSINITTIIPMISQPASALPLVCMQPNPGIRTTIRVVHQASIVVHGRTTIQVAHGRVAIRAAHGQAIRAVRPAPIVSAAIQAARGSLEARGTFNYG